MPEQAINATLGLDGLEVIAVSLEGEAIEVVVESRFGAGSCRSCGGIAAEPKERPHVLTRDLSISGRPVMLRWIKRRWRCTYCANTWTETHPEIPPRARMTRRFKRHLAQRATLERNFSQVAAAEGVSYDTVARAHRARAQLALAKKRPRPSVLAIDEAAVRKGHSYCTVISDPQRRYVIDMLPGRGVVQLRAWLASLPPEVKEGIDVVVMDLFDPFHLAVAASLPRALRVADKFHVLRNVNHALDRQRSRLQGRGHKTGGRRRLFQSRFLLLRGVDSLNSGERGRLEGILFELPELERGWRLKEEFRAIYDFYGDQPALAEQALEAWFAAAQASEIPEFVRLAANLRRWKPQLLAFFTYRITNGFAEGVTNRIKVIKRQAYGIPDFRSFRRRVLIECGTPKVRVPA